MQIPLVAALCAVTISVSNASEDTTWTGQRKALLRQEFSSISAATANRRNGDHLKKVEHDSAQESLRQPTASDTIKAELQLAAKDLQISPDETAQVVFASQAVVPPAPEATNTSLTDSVFFAAEMLGLSSQQVDHLKVAMANLDHRSYVHILQVLRAAAKAATTAATLSVPAKVAAVVTAAAKANYSAEEVGAAAAAASLSLADDAASTTVPLQGLADAVGQLGVEGQAAVVAAAGGESWRSQRMIAEMFQAISSTTPVFQWDSINAHPFGLDPEIVGDAVKDQMESLDIPEQGGCSCTGRVVPCLGAVGSAILLCILMNPQDQAQANPYNYQQWAGAMQNMQNMQEAMPGQGMGYGGMSQQQMQQMQMQMMMQQMAMQQQMGAMSPQMLAAMQAQAQAFSGQMPQSGPSNGLNANAPEYDPTASMSDDKVAQPTKEPTQLETVTVGLFLEEIAYFMEDMERDLWWLLRMAHQPAGPPELIHGDEVIEPVDAAVEAAIQKLKERADKHAEEHVAQVRAKIVIIPSVDKTERSILNGLRKLKFHCQGQVEVFPCMKEANNAAIWQAYFNCVAGMEPQWMMKSDGPGAKGVFARSGAIVPIYVDRNKKEIKVFNVWCPEKKKRHWAFLEGDILRGADRHIYDTCRRVFNNKVGHLFGKDWSGCFLAELPQQAGAEPKDPSICSFVKLEQDGHQYPCRPHFFLQVTEDFYETTRCYEDASGVIKLPQPQGDFVKWDDLASAKRLHLDGTFFMVHDEARWVILEYSTGKLLAEDTRQLRKENGDLLRSQPEKVWKWLADRAGLDMVQRNSGLPDDFPEDGPFSVRMSGIDKTASDDDIEKYFEERDVKVKSVEQFDVPRHTARIDFHDKASLEIALQLSGHSLLRRKVKVELWTDDPDAAAAMGAKPLKPYTGPLPEEGPYKVIVRGLDKSVTQRDLGYFFWDRDCECEGVMYPLKNERHAGTVEFKDQESLRKALGLNSAVFKGREITVSIMTKEDNKPEPARRLGSSGGAPGAGGGGKGMGKSRGDDRGMGRREDRGPPSRAEFGSERPRLELKPRSKPMPGDAGYQEDSPPRASGRPDPFGGARYRTTRADADDNWRR